MNILIIEDEQPASDRIIAMVREFDAGTRILATLRSVRESVEWLSAHPAPDLILADIQLGDGLSLDIFHTVRVPSPLIFTTAFDEYLMKAFAYNSIDYLLKPVNKEKLFRALNKYASLRQHFTGDIVSLLEQLHKGERHGAARMVVKKGTDFIALKTEEIAYFYTEHKIVFLVDKNGRRFIVDKPLADLERELPAAAFFRVNRKFLASVDSVVKFRSADKGKLRVDLRPAAPDEVIVSQENASAFKRWMDR